ncbi:TLDc domain-containing protein [Entamoeba marina]
MANPYQFDALRDHMDLLKRWTGSSDYKEIYNCSSGHRKQLRSAAELNKALEGKDNLVFVITSNKENIFGFYSSHGIQSDGGNIWEDDDHFVFTLKNNIGVKPKKYKRRVNGMLPIVTVWDDQNEDNVVVVPGFCWITNASKPSFVYRNFGNVYDDDGDGYGVLCENEIKLEKKSNGSFVSVKSLVVFQMTKITREVIIKGRVNRLPEKKVIDEVFSSYGKCNIELKESAMAVITYENVKSSIKCAAFHAKDIFHEGFVKIKESIDNVPQSIGVEINQGKFLKIINKDSPIPVQQTITFPLKFGETQPIIRIYQGEGNFVHSEGMQFIDNLVLKNTLDTIDTTLIQITFRIGNEFFEASAIDLNDSENTTNTKVEMKDLFNSFIEESLEQIYEIIPESF